MSTLYEKIKASQQTGQRLPPISPVQPGKTVEQVNMEKIVADRSRGVTISQGTVDPVQVQRQRLSKIPFIGQFLTGTGPQGNADSLYEPGSMQQDLVEKGIVGFLLEGFQKKVNPTRAEVGEQIFTRYDKLADVEPDPEKRLQIAVQDVISGSLKSGPGGLPPVNIASLNDPKIQLSEKAKDALFWTNVVEDAFAVLDAPIFVGSTKIPKNALLKFLKEADKVEDIVPRLRMIGLGEKAASEVAPKIAKSTNEIQIARILEDAKTIAADAAKPSLFSRIQDRIATKFTPGRTSRFADDAAKMTPESQIDTPVVKRADEAGESESERFFRASQAKGFEEVLPDQVVPAFIREDLDTFVTKVGDEFQVVEGRTGQQIGDGGKSVAEAVQSAKQEVANLGDERLKEFINNSPLSPRYTQVREKAPVRAAKEMPAPLPEGVITADKLRLTDKSAARRLSKLETMAKTASDVDKFVDSTGITREALEATVKKQGYKDVEQFFKTNRPPKVSKAEAVSRSRQAEPDNRSMPDEDEYYSLLSEQKETSDAFVTTVAKEEAEEVVDNLRAVFADMKGIDLNDPALKFTEEDLEKAQLEYEFVMETLMDDPGRALSRFVSKKEGQFLDFKDPNTAKTPSERARIEERNQRVTKAAESAFEGTRWADVFDDPDVIREAIESYQKRRTQAQEIFDNLRKVRNSIRLAKQMDTFVDVNQKKLAAEFMKNRKALTAIVEAAEKAGFRKGLAKGNEKYEKLVNILRDRRHEISGIKFRYNLTNAEMRKATARAQDEMDDLAIPEDPRFMKKEEFNEYVQKLEVAAHEFEMRRTERGIVKAIIDEKGLKNTENLRDAMQLPPLTQMNLEQLERFGKVLNKFKDGDEFLSTRTLEVIDRTALKGARTVRQVQEYLAVEMKKILGRDVSPSELENLTAGAGDYLKFDTALAESKPFYGFMVNRAQKHMMEGEANFLRLQDRFQELAKAAKDSRKKLLKTKEGKIEVKKNLKAAREALKDAKDPDTIATLKTTIRRLKWQLGIRGKLKPLLAPTHHEIVRYLEARDEIKDLYFKSLTKEEQELARFARNYYNNAYNHLSYINEIYGGRYIDAYFTHMRKDFLEAFTDDGFVAAVKNWRDAWKEDMAIANIIDADTGKILPKSKFFQYTLKRTGDGPYSENFTRVFLKYAQMFERKKMLDKMVPELDIYTNSLTPKELTQRGLEMDRTLKEFVNNYLNNKRGRKFNYGGLIKQNGAWDIALRAANAFVSLMDLGLNFTSGAASLVGEQVANFVALGNRGTLKGFKRRLWDTGAKRMFDPKAAAILKQAEPFIGRNIWTEIAEVDKPIIEKGLQTMFGLFSQSSAEASKIFLLGSLTDAELKAGKISAQRMADLRLEAGRWRDMGASVKSITGATSLGSAVTKYKGWAIPILRRNAEIFMNIAKTVKSLGKKNHISKKDAVELMREIEVTSLALIVGNALLTEENDDSALGKLRARIRQETLTLLGGVDPTVFLATPRIYSYAQQLGTNLKQLALLEEYQQDGKYGDKGDLKGWGGLKQQFIPAFIRQFLPSPEPKKSSSSKAIKTPPGLPALPAVGKSSLPKLPALPKPPGG